MRKCLHLLFLCGLFIFSTQQAAAQCNEPEPPGDGPNACADAPIFCSEADLDGYCSSTYESGVGPCPPAFCGSCENYQFIGFIANSTTIQLEITSNNCQGTPNGSGVQAHMYDNCTDLNPVSDCWSSGGQGTGVITATGLVVGQVYYLMIDGWAGDQCDWSIQVLQGVGDVPTPIIPGPITGPVNACPGAPLDYFVPPALGATNYEWTITPAIGSVTNGQGTTDAEITWNAPGVAQVCVTPSNACESGPPVCMQVIVTPIPPTIYFEEVCLGQTVQCEGNTYSGPGVFDFVYESYLGCDSMVTCVVTLIPIVIEPPMFATVCGGECVEFDGADVCETGAYQATYDTWQGCDSIVTLTLIVVEAEATVATPPVLGCGGSTVTLDATGSTQIPAGGVGVITYEWTGPPGGIVGPNDEIMADVNQAGFYTFTITQEYDGIICTDMVTVEVTEDIAFPGDPSLSGPDVGCTGSVDTYSAAADPNGPAPTGFVWTVTGGTFVDNGSSIDVTWTAGSVGQVCVEAVNDCGPSNQVCIDVTLGAGAALPNLVGPTGVCDGDLITYMVDPVDPDAVYNWTVTGGASFIDNGSSADVDFDGATNGQVCVSATNSCGTSADVCIDFSVLDVPFDPVIMGSTDLCLGETATYSVSADPNADTYAWTVQGGTFVDNGNSIDVTWDATGDGQVCVIASNVCGASAEICLPTFVNPAPTATISVSGDNEFCAGSGDLIDLTIELTGSGPWTVTYQLDGGSDVTIPIATSPFTLQVGQAGTYTILSVSDQSSCPGIPSGSADVIENPLPTATISGNGSICAGSGDCAPLQIDFTGTGPWSITVAIDGSANAPINGIVDNPFIYDGCEEGSYTIVSVTGDNGCTNTGSGTGTVTENTAPQAVGIFDTCDPTNTEYTISFEITGGDPSSYTVNGSNAGISGGPPYIFTSGPIPTGSPYSFVVDDANGCNPVTVAGTVVCDCTTDVGSMDQAPLSACGDGACITATYDNGEILDGNDAVEFVLHEGSGISIVNEIDRNSIPEFCFNAGLGMTYGTTYYISAIVGDDLGGGTVDTGDPCLAVAQGTQVVYNEEPTATLDGNPVVCEGDVATFTVTFTGPGPYSITYEDPLSVATTLNGISANPYSLQVSPAMNGTYCLTGVSNDDCPGVANGCGDVVVNTAPVVDNVATACNATVTAFTVTFDITSGDPGSYVVDPPGSGVITPGTPAVFTSNEIPAGNIYFFQVYDANGCDTITVTTAVPVDCDCVTEAGSMDLTPLEICGDGPAIGIYDDTNQMLDGDDVVEFILHSGSGSSIGATIYGINTVPEFSFDPGAGMTYGTTYYMSVMAGSDDGSGSVDYPNDLCLDVSVGTPVTFYEVPTGDLSVVSSAICLGDTTNVQVALTGDAPYTVVISDGTNLDTITDINNTPFNYPVSPGASTTYTLIEIFDENCPGTIAGSELVDVNEAPTTGVGDVTINGTNTGYVVCFDIMGGEPPYIITNGVDTLAITSDAFFCSAEIPCGSGYYFEVDDANDCGPAIVEEAIVDCPCLTQVGTMDQTLIEVCGDGPADATYDDATQFLDGNDVVNYILHNGDNVPITTAATPSFSFNSVSMTYGTTYFISAQAGDDNGSGGVNTTDPCLSIALGTPVVFYEIPSVTITGGGDICLDECTDLIFTVTGGEGPYTVIYDGSGVLDTVTSMDAVFTVEVCPTISTVYTTVSMTDSNCDGVVAGLVSVNVNAPPGGVNVTSTIDPTNTFYTLCFDIVGGDAASYTVDPPGTITGTTYCSDPISCGDDYFFLVDDINGCGPDTIQGTVQCPCVSNSGTMDLGLIEGCEGETISVNPAVGAVLDGNDVQQYVLHTSAANALGTVIMISDTPSFTYDGSVMDCNITYYISSVVGDDDGAGNFDPDDFCLSVAFGQAVRWNCSPSAELVGGATLCLGDMTSVQFNLTGAGPFDVVVNNGTTDTTFTNLTDGFTWDITPSASITYTLVSVINTTTGCSAVENGSIDIVVNLPVDAGSVADEVRLCEDVSLVVTLADLLDGEDAGGAWSETSIVPSVGGAFNSVAGIFNTVGQIPGTYTFRYLLDAGDPCVDDENTVQVIIDPVPVADAGEDKEITCDETEHVLGGSGTSVGSELSYEWVELVSATVVGSSAELSVTEAGTYELTVINTVTGCTSSDQVVVENSVDYPVPEVSVSDISCFGDDDGFFVIENITGGVPPYVCSLNGGPFTQQKQFTNLSAGIYELIILDSKGCETALTLELTQPEELIVEIVTNIEGEDPIIELGDSVQITAVISIDSVDVIQWSPEGIITCDTCATTYAYPEVQTTFSVTVQEGECTDSDTYTILVEKPRPVFIPNIFSPTSVNGNDVFFISAGPQVAKIRSFLVFDRWGETVHQYYNFLPNNPAFGWDGNYRGQPMNAGVYIYYAEIEFIDGYVELYEGDVTLVR